MLTIPAKRGEFDFYHWLKLFEVWNVKKHVVGLEEGKNGYKHWQARIQLSGEGKQIIGGSEISFFQYMKIYYPKAHIEEASNTWEYERKEGKFWTSEDTASILAVRFGSLRPEQKKILQILESQGDREIDVWLDPSGNHGKSWLTVHLWETGRALVVPRSSTTAEKLSAFICSSWKGEPIVIIDIPRSTKVSGSLLETMEELKDGLVFDHRYTGRTRNVRGVKVMVFTNSELPLKKLSKDRWRLHGIACDGSLT
ncbi:putative replicase protein [Camel associated porprismacovirus 4]|uniref:Putative replicase protein n=1 Tax=Camel associated porprismacovirus 4 TaxID=2170108 RepID=A0A0A1EKX0_9VIRU|nr:putative replicase protein [Camel associated porprismacovirus 4]AIY31259.1 putative replicase protein [Camel associated porprismacovirus 4]